MSTHSLTKAALRAEGLPRRRAVNRLMELVAWLAAALAIAHPRRHRLVGRAARRRRVEPRPDHEDARAVQLRQRAVGPVERVRRDARHRRARDGDGAAGRDPRRDLPERVRTPVDPLVGQPRARRAERRAGDRDRHLRLRALRRRSRPERLRRRVRARVPDAAARRTLDARGARARAGVAARGEPRARRAALADDAFDRPAADARRHRHRARCSRSRASRARPRRCSSRRRSSARSSTGTRITPCRPCRSRSSSSRSRPTRPITRRRGPRRSSCCSSSSARASCARWLATRSRAVSSTTSDRVEYDRPRRGLAGSDAQPLPPRERLERIFQVEGLDALYGGKPAVKDVTMDVYKNLVTAIIGPSGCGKSTFIRCLNRMNDLIPAFSQTGTIRYHGQDITARDVDPVAVRRNIGMVFQRPNPFPKSIYDNVAWGLQGARAEGRPRRPRRTCAHAGCALGRGEGSAEGERALAVGRPAAATLHRACDRRRAGRRADGRAGVGARPDRDVGDRAADARPEERVHVRDRHAQHAAGRARRRHDGVLLDLPRRRRRALGRARRVRATEKIFTDPSDKRTEDYVTGRFG